MITLEKKLSGLVKNKSLNYVDIFLQLLNDKYLLQDIELTYATLFNRYFNETQISEVITRVHQGKFRDELIKKYGSCVISGIPATVCEASHIYPFCLCSPEQQYDINNGILLNANLHKLFDKFAISIHPDDHIFIVSKHILHDSSYSFASIYQNKYIPNLSQETSIYLKYHYEQFLLNDLKN